MFHFEGKKKQNEYRETRDGFERKNKVIKMAEIISYEKQQNCESELTCFSPVFITCWLCDFGTHYLSFWISISHL